MSDYSGYVLMASVIIALFCIERLRPASTDRNGEWVNNGAAWVFTAASHTILIGSLAASETAAVNSLGGGLIDLRALPLGLGALLYLLAMDLGEYLFHRAQHAIPALWAMHSLHHSDRSMNVATTQRHFWLEPAIKSLTIWLVVAVAFHASGTILGIYVLFSFGHFLTHSNIRLGFGAFSWLFNSPQYHRLHHSVQPDHHNANFAALLPIFDVISGAYHQPRPGEFPATGLDDAPRSPIEVLLWPVRGRWRRTMGAKHPGASSSVSIPTGET